MTDVQAMPHSSHLETIDYKPPAVATSNSPTNNTMSPPTSTLSLDEKKMDDNDQENDEEVDLYSEEAEWDEGGKSHCGYSESVHATLMSVGESVHGMIGEPSPRVEKELKAVGNWFQEASYAARDLFGTPQEGQEGSVGMKEDALDAVKTLLRGGSKDEKNGDKLGTSTSATGSEGENQENKDPSVVAIGSESAPIVVEDDAPVDP